MGAGSYYCLQALPLSSAFCLWKPCDWQLVVITRPLPYLIAHSLRDADASGVVKILARILWGVHCYCPVTAQGPARSGT